MAAAISVEESRTPEDSKDFEPEATEHVRILDEKLHIRAGKSQASVSVRYLMRNMTDKKVKIRFGFPIEESFSVAEILGPSDSARQDKPIYCKNYQITAAGKPLKVKWQDELNPENDQRMNRLAGWNISELTFAAGQEMPVTIDFESEYPHESWSVSDNTSDSAGIFRYRLSTAACWHGNIARGHIVIEPDGIAPGDIRIIKPVNRFKKQGEKWVWDFENLEPTLNDDLEIECQPAVNSYGHQPIGKYRENHPEHLYAEYIQRGGNWSMLHSNYTVKASSTLGPDGEIRYDPENIRERWAENAWSEGAAGPGVGAWLDITPEVPKPLLAIHLRPGYQKEKGNLFKANARPKSIRIELNGAHRYDVEIPDREEQIEIPVTGYIEPVRKIRLTFTEVYPGDQYQDLCITSLMLHSKLDRKPDVSPAR